MIFEGFLTREYNWNMQMLSIRSNLNSNVNTPTCWKVFKNFQATRMVDICINIIRTHNSSRSDCNSKFEHRRTVSDMEEVYKHLLFYEPTTIPRRFNLRIRPSRNHSYLLERLFAKDILRGALSTFRLEQTMERATIGSSSIAEFPKGYRKVK